MTSKNLFWASSRENHKRRIWVWIVAVLSQLLVYSAMSTIYLSRIKNQYEIRAFWSVEAFRRAMYQAARDALAFSDNLWPVLLFLGAVIGMQGFSYLYDRRKVDMYHSVPVSKKSRFMVIYVNGIIIYLTGNLAGLLTGTVIAAAHRSVNVDVLANAGLAFLWNLLLFLVFYHTMILAVMLSGSRFVTLCLFGMFTLYEIVLFWILENMKWSFFKTATSHYLYTNPRLSPLFDCMNEGLELKNAKDAAQAAGLCLPLCGKWILIAAVLFAAAWLCYTRRQSEAAGQAIVYRVVEPIVKIAAVIPAGLIVGMVVYNTSYNNEMLMVAGMLISGVIFCAALEVLFAFDIKSLFKHLWSGGIALAGILAVFCIYKWDIIGYDSYIPEGNKIESIAISVSGYYDNYWNDNLEYISQADFEKQHMFLTDTEPVLTLARQFQPAEWEKMEDPRSIEVLYRLKSGRQVNRCFMVDYADDNARKQLNRIMGSEAYKKGVFQDMTKGISADKLVSITYSNGAAKVTIPKEECARLKEAWIKDMEQYDFTLVRENHPCGEITLQYVNYLSNTMPVYEKFENTIACLESLEAYYPVKLNVADIEYVTVTNYHNELNVTEQMQYDDPGREAFGFAEAEAVAVDFVEDIYVDHTVRETFYDEAQIAEILENIHPMWMISEFAGRDATEESYDVEVVFKKDTTYPYERDSYYFNYSFLGGQVPEFVVEATAYEAE